MGGGVPLTSPPGFFTRAKFSNPFGGRVSVRRPASRLWALTARRSCPFFDFRAFLAVREELGRRAPFVQNTAVSVAPAGDAEQAAICNPVRNPFVTVGPYKRRRGVGVSSPRLRRSHRNRRRTCRPQSPAAGTSGQPVGVSFPGQRLRANASAPAAGPCPRLRIRRRQSSPGDRPERVETFRFRPCSGCRTDGKRTK